MSKPLLSDELSLCSDLSCYNEKLLSHDEIHSDQEVSPICVDQLSVNDRFLSFDYLPDELENNTFRQVKINEPFSKQNNAVDMTSCGKLSNNQLAITKRKRSSGNFLFLF